MQEKYRWNHCHKIGQYESLSSSSTHFRAKWNSVQRKLTSSGRRATLSKVVHTSEVDRGTDTTQIPDRISWHSISQNIPLFFKTLQALSHLLTDRQSEATQLYSLFPWQTSLPMTEQVGQNEAYRKIGHHLQGRSANRPACGYGDNPPNGTVCICYDFTQLKECFLSMTHIPSVKHLMPCTLCVQSSPTTRK